MIRRLGFISTLLGIFVLSACSSPADELTVEEALALIKESEHITEVHFTNSTVTISAGDEEHFVTSVGSDATRELLLQAIHKGNDSRSAINITESQSSSASIYLLILNLMPFILLLTGMVIPVLLFLIYRELKKRSDNAEKLRK